MSNTIAKDEFQKSLARLGNLAKGQLFHTPSDSQPGTWAGSSAQDEDSMDDGIQENGTDYDGVKKALGNKVAACKALTPAEVCIIKGQSPYKAIAAKVEKGLALTGAEKWALKGGRSVFKSDGMANSPKKDGAGEENKEAREVPDGNVADKADGKKVGEASKGMPFGDDEDEDDAKKSLADAARRQPNLSKGIEMSPILHEFAVAMGQALAGQEQRVVKSVAEAIAPIVERVARMEKSFAQKSEMDGEFQKALAEAVTGMGAHLAGNVEVDGVNKSMPVAGPRSTLRALPGGQAQGVAPIAKSFEGPGGLESGDLAMAKSQLVSTMTEMVKSNKLNPLEVVKFESTGQLSPQTQQAIAAFASGNGRG